MALYKESKYRNAAGVFQEVQDKFPTSERLSEYTYLHHLSELRDRLNNQERPALETIDDLQRFIADNKDALPLQDNTVLILPRRRPKRCLRW